MALYNHMFTIAFSLENSSEDGGGTTAVELRTAILERAHRLSDEELIEACGFPDDTYIVEED